ncbi:MAG: acylneuraminate cytidylyltransferase family protein [Caldilineaceae bacterium]
MPVLQKIAQEWGAEVPFTRPSELAQDRSSHIGVVVHALEWLAEHKNQWYDYVMLLQPTVPLRTAQDIDAAIEIAAKTNADSVISVFPADRHPYLAKSVCPDGRLQDMVFRIENDLPRQGLPPAYTLNGAIYLIRSKFLIEHQTWYSDNTFAYVMPPERSLDIDTDWEFHLTDLVLKDPEYHVHYRNR